MTKFLGNSREIVSQEKNQICLRKALSERETEMKKAWKKWRLEFIKRKTAKTISDYNEKMLLSQTQQMVKG
ncbi:hypothetical protein KUTeg_001973 [Tegillarca granosa]|uniref:Uncharacterized protein n=1 Tax=Tegillarca granosa TaxID=220873 RepID=A0ABQ9FUF0_TEGGR|nr:hypothetical protein KUTeg_001973 [Tegillarca granosa]